MREVAIAVVEHENRFLIGQRGPDVALAGYWEFPGGKLEPGESAAAAAIRECREEARLAVEVVGKYPTVEHQYVHGLLRIHFLDCRPVDPAAAPAAPYRWVDRGELHRYQFPEANAELLARLNA